MQPQLFFLFGSAVPSYFGLLLVGFVMATAMGALWAKRIGQDPDVIVDLGLSMLIWGVIGARILHVLADGYFWDYVHLCTDPSEVLWKISRAECVRSSDSGWLGQLLGQHDGPLGRWDAKAGGCRPLHRDCFAWARFWAGGLTYYGGLLLALPLGFRQLRRDHFPIGKALDMAGMVIPVGLCFGRMGCLLAGCCFGQPLNSPLALVFPPGSAASFGQAKAGLLADAELASLAVHPTQIYESASCLALAAALTLWLTPRKRYDGQVFLAFIAGYAVIRFCLEFVRADDRGGFAGLSTSQWIGLALCVGVALAHRKLRARRLSGPTS